MYEREEKKAVQLIVLICYSLLSMALIGESILMGWDTSVVFLIMLGLVVSWAVHVLEKFTGKLRLWIYFVLSMLSVFFYGIHETSMFDLAPLVIVVMIVFYATEISSMITLCVVTYYVTMIYDFFFVIDHSVEISPLTVSRTILHFVLVFFAGYLVNIVIKRRKKAKINTNNRIAALEETNRRTEDFLTNVSHELRTPINVVTGITSVMLNNEEDEEKRDNLLSIQTAGHRLFSQIGAILDYTEIDTGRITVSEDTYMISSLINDVIVGNRLAERNKSLELIFDVDSGIPAVLMGDEKKIKKIMEQLIDNAAKFTEVGGIYVRVSALRKEYGINLCIQVNDTGIGIAEEELNKIRKRFYQTNGGRNRKAGGLGLGLSIVYGMVSALEGFIQIESEEGKGTTVSISIPQKVMDDSPSMELANREKLCLACYLRPEKYSVPQVRNYYNDMISHMIQELDMSLHRVIFLDELKKLTSLYQLTHIFIGKEEYEEEPSYFEELGQTVNVILVVDEEYALPQGSRMKLLKKPFYSLPVVNMLNAGTGEGGDLLKEKYMICPDVKVLVVDDEPMNLMVAEGIFKDYQMKVVTAEGGRRAIELCEKEDFDLIFLDHMMPEMDGVETIKRLRKMSTAMGKVLTVIAFTANAVSGAREMFLREGFDEFISKPIETLELERILKKVLPKSSISFVDKDERKVLLQEGEARGKQGILKEESPAEDQGEASEDDTMKMLESAGIKTHSGIQYCGGDKDFYGELLTKFAKDAKTKAEEINEFFQKEDMDNYGILVHALKSTAKMIGANVLSEQAKQMEDAAKKHDEEYIKDNHAELLAQYKQLVGSIFGALSLKQTDVNASTEEKKPEISTEDLLFWLTELIGELNTFEMDRVEPLLEKINGHSYQGDDLEVLLEDIQKEVDDFEFSSAVEKVQALINKMEGGEDA